MSGIHPSIARHFPMRALSLHRRRFLPPSFLFPSPSSKLSSLLFLSFSCQVFSLHSFGFVRSSIDHYQHVRTDGQTTSEEGKSGSKRIFAWLFFPPLYFRVTLLVVVKRVEKFSPLQCSIFTLLLRFFLSVAFAGVDRRGLRNAR